MSTPLRARVITGVLTTALFAGPAMAQDAPGPTRATLSGLQTLDFQAEQTDRETRTLDLGSAGSLELRNVLGDVTVTAGSGTSAAIEIIRRSRGRTDEDARLGLEQVSVEVAEAGGRASVVARYPENRRSQPTYQVSVTYQVTAPVGTRLTVDTVSGNVTLHGIHGDIAVDLINGDIEIADATRLSKVGTVSGSVTLTDIDSDESVNVTNLAGTVRLDRVRATRVDVNAVSGAVTASNITANSAKMTTMAGRISYSGPLTASGRYEFQAHNGNIEFTVEGSAGFELRASTFSGSIDAGSGIDTTGLSKSQRSLRGRVGDGDAVVSLTTFSGDVIIRRR